MTRPRYQILKPLAAFPTARAVSSRAYTVAWASIYKTRSLFPLLACLLVVVVVVVAVKVLLLLHWYCYTCSIFVSISWVHILCYVLASVHIWLGLAQLLFFSYETLACIYTVICSKNLSSADELKYVGCKHHGIGRFSEKRCIYISIDRFVQFGIARAVLENV